jgi:hypothetical protein
MLITISRYGWFVQLVVHRLSRASAALSRPGAVFDAPEAQIAEEFAKFKPHGVEFQKFDCSVHLSSNP